MFNLDKDSENILLGALIGGIVGSALSYYLATRHTNEKNSLHVLEKAIDQAEKIAKSHDIDDFRTVLKELNQKSGKSKSAIPDVLEWVATGVSLWNKVKK